MERWSGAQVVIVASGPSLTAGDGAAAIAWRDADRAQRKVIAINTSYRMAPTADVIYGCDAVWWEWFSKQSDSNAVTGERWTQDKPAAHRYDLRWIESQRGAGLSKYPAIYQGGNGGHQAVALAARWGASRIILLGFDMQDTGGASHWHGDHPAGLQKIPPFASWIEQMGKLAADLKAAGIDTINASRATALTSFRRESLESALSMEALAA